MSQISVTAAQPFATGTTVSPTPVNPTVEERALNRSVAAGVQTLNNAGYAGDGREVTYSVDQATRRLIVKVVDTATREVVQQWPAEYMLRLAADIKQLTRDSA
jgi:uncharacterized FlaG/YvyC family protein